jgi:hypothetical protein
LCPEIVKRCGQAHLLTPVWPGSPKPIKGEGGEDRKMFENKVLYELLKKKREDGDRCREPALNSIEG